MGNRPFALLVWLKAHLMRSLPTALNTPWILDIDTTIKVLYGHQQGAEVGYNPHKPGRPSHALHTYWVGNLRLVLDILVSPGKQTSASHAHLGLARQLKCCAHQQFITHHLSSGLTTPRPPLFNTCV